MYTQNHWKIKKQGRKVILFGKLSSIIEQSCKVERRNRQASRHSTSVRTYGRHKRGAFSQAHFHIRLLPARKGAATLLIALRLRRTSTYLRTYTQTAVKIKPSMGRCVDILLLWVADSAATALTWSKKKDTMVLVADESHAATWDKISTRRPILPQILP